MLRSSKLSQEVNNLQKGGEDLHAVLNQQLEVQQTKENLRLEYARLAQDYSAWVKESLEGLADLSSGNVLASLEAVIGYKAELDRSDQQYLEVT